MFELLRLLFVYRLLGFFNQAQNVAETKNPLSDSAAVEWLQVEVPVSTFLGLPLFQGGELIGVVGLVNRDGGYDEGTPALLEPFATPEERKGRWQK